MPPIEKYIDDKTINEHVFSLAKERFVKSQLITSGDQSKINWTPETTINLQNEDPRSSKFELLSVKEKFKEFLIAEKFKKSEIIK